MAVTSEQLQRAGASAELSNLLAKEFRRESRRDDVTRNPMAVGVTVTFMAAFLSALAWLVLAVTETQTDLARLEVKIDEGQARLEADIDEIKEILGSRD